MKTLNIENFEQQDLPFKVNRLSPNIGAELLEIDLREDFDEKTYEFIYQALLIYKVIFFSQTESQYRRSFEVCKKIW